MIKCSFCALGNVSGPLPESDIGNITLALQTLGSFNFGGICSHCQSVNISLSLSLSLSAHLPLQLVQSVADMYLSSEHKSIRLEAVKTCTALLVPALLPPTIFTTPFVQFSQASAQVVAEVLRKLLTVGITDTGVSIDPSYQSIYPSYQSICPFIHLYIYPSIHLSIYTLIHLYIHPSFHHLFLQMKKFASVCCCPLMINLTLI